VRKPITESGGSGGLSTVMSGNDSISATSVSSVPGSQLVSTTGEEESASTATSATGILIDL